MEYVQQFLSNSVLSTLIGLILSALGIILAVYYGNKVTHKKILYRILVRQNSFIVAFWNASGPAIKKEDIYYMRLHCSENAKVKVVYSCDNEIPLEITSVTESSNNHNMEFNFLLKRQGYLIEVTDVESVSITGRLRAETKESVMNAIKIEEDEKNVIAGLMKSAFLIACYLAIAKLSTDNAITFGLALSAYCAQLFSALSIVSFIANQSMPKSIKKEFNEYIKSGYTEIG